MPVYLIRVGAPVAAVEAPLSERGRQRVAVAARLAADEGASITSALVAPNQSCRDTAAVAAAALGGSGHIEDFKSLSPGAQPQVPVRRISAAGNVLVVADEPEIGRIAAMLVGRPSFPPFEHGHLVCVERGAPAWVARPDLGRVEMLPFE